MTYAYTDNAQIDECDEYDEEYLSSVWEDDQALEEFSLECAYGPND